MTQEITELKREIRELKQEMAELKRTFNELQQSMNDLKAKQPEQNKETGLEKFFKKIKDLILEYTLNMKNWISEDDIYQQREIYENKLIQEYRILEEQPQEITVLNKLHNNYFNLNINHGDLRGKNLLQILVYCKFNKTLKEFLRQFDFLISEPSMDGNKLTILHLAIFENNLEGFKIIMNGIKTVLKNKNNKQKEKYIEDIFYAKNTNSSTAMDYAMRTNHEGFIDEFFSFFEDENITPDPRMYSKQRFFESIRQSCFVSLSSLLAYDFGRIYINSNGDGSDNFTPLNLIMKITYELIRDYNNGIKIDNFTSSVNDHINFAILLIEVGADPFSEYKQHQYANTCKGFMNEINKFNLSRIPLDRTKLDKLSALFNPVRGW